MIVRVDFVGSVGSWGGLVGWELFCLRGTGFEDEYISFYLRFVEGCF